jgi:hypothetical protein
MISEKHSPLTAARDPRTGQVTIMTAEDREAFHAFSVRLIKSLAPEGELELQLALRLVKDTWRLNRLSAIEDNLFALGHSDNSQEIAAEHPQAHAALVAAHTFTVEAKHLQVLSLYEQRLNRAYHKNLAIFRAMQSERKAQQAPQPISRSEKDLAAAEPLRQVSANAPKENGFVFLNAGITAPSDRTTLVTEAAIMVAPALATVSGGPPHDLRFT